MALIRGANGHCPCPICLVPKNKQLDLTKNYPLRTQASMQTALKDARAMKLSSDQENCLKTIGLRNIDVCLSVFYMKIGLKNVQNIFWSVANSDPYAALSWDRLHAYHTGLFGKHLWPELQMHINNLGREAAQTVDRR
jgi:hypothetical protein